MLNKKVIKDIYKSLFLIREAELTISRIYNTDKIKSPVHLSIGQEPIAVGICKNLKKKDFVSNTYRSHATFLAKGGSLKSFFAELFGKETGCAGGRGGSMHLVDIKNGVIGTSAVVGTTIPIAAGYSLKEKIKKNKNIVVCFFGDGATEEGCFYETLNFASLKSLPILFVCENNHLAIHTKLSQRWSKNNLVEKVKKFGIKAKKIKSNDVIKIYSETKKIIQKIRNERKPYFIEIECLREFEHVGPKSDINKEYRDKKFSEKFTKNIFQNTQFNKLNENEKKIIEQQVIKNIRDAIDFSEKSKFPNKKKILENVY
jgi:pyruvate dehydrogenase E1 component alpha subunit